MGSSGQQRRDVGCSSMEWRREACLVKGSSRGGGVLGTMDHAGMDQGAPETVTPVERYVRDLGCLRELTSSAEPPKQLNRA
jgi:hypothetical protein